MTRQTTNKQMKYFAKRVAHWQEVLGLFDWKIQVGRDSIGAVVANCEMWHDSHGANIILNLDIPQDSGEWDEKFLDKVALHEVSHVLLCDLKAALEDRAEIRVRERVEHALIRRLEHALCD